MRSMSRGDIHGYLRDMIPHHEPTADAISDHFFGEYDEFASNDGNQEGGPLAIYDNLPIVHPAAQVAAFCNEAERRLAIACADRERAEQVASQLVASKQWTSEVMWRSGDRVLRIGDMDDSHLENSIRYSRRRGMWGSMATLMIEQQKRQIQRQEKSRQSVLAYASDL